MKAICAALATSLLLASTGAWAQEPSKKDVAEAKSLFKEGIGLYKNGKHAQALEKFRSSYELRPHWKLHLNIGLCYKELAMYTAAKTEFAAFIEEGGGKVNADEKKQVLMELENLEKIIAVLDIDAGPTGAEIQLDGKSQGLAPLDDPIEVDPGSHVLEVSLEGHYPYREEFLVSKGEQKSVQVTLEKEPEEVPDEPVEPVEPVEDEKKARTKGAPAFWVMGGLTLASTAAAIAFGAVTLGKDDDIRKLDQVQESALPGQSEDEYQAYLSERNQLQDDGKLFGTLTTVFMVTAGAALVGTIIAGVLTHPFGPKPGESQDAVSWHLTPTPLMEGGGMLLIGASF